MTSRKFMVVKQPKISEYERKSRENREFLRNMYFRLFKDDINADKEFVDKVNKRKEEEKRARRIEAAKKRAEKVELNKSMMATPRRSKRLLLNNSGDVNCGPLYVKVGTKSDSISTDWSTYADEDENYHEQRRRRPKPNLSGVRTELKPEEVTEEHIKNIAPFVSTKVYSSDGTTCHQCRQKTLDTKTVCRSEECFGVRGQFCGVCLNNRYGESVAEALLDAKWSCPPCRGLCNCSICRTREGKRPTGQLYTHAVASGYKSVLDYLKQCDKNNDETSD